MRSNEKLGWCVYWCGVAFICFCIALWIQGCGGSNIPIDPVCEDLLAHQEKERAEFECVLPEPATPGLIPVPVCDARVRALFELCKSSRSTAIEEAYEAGYEAGYEDGESSVVCEPWSCDDFAGLPNRHKPKACRHQHDKDCRHRHDSDEDSDSE